MLLNILNVLVGFSWYFLHILIFVIFRQFFIFFNEYFFVRHFVASSRVDLPLPFYIFTPFLYFCPSGPRIPDHCVLLPFFSHAHRGCGYLLAFSSFLVLSPLPLLFLLFSLRKLAHPGCGYLLLFFFFSLAHRGHGYLLSTQTEFLGPSGPWIPGFSVFPCPSGPRIPA